PLDKQGEPSDTSNPGAEAVSAACVFG
ncbi:MAG: hypothetical protein RL689_2512, partial [Planctomycetota bacterium]